MGDRFKDFSEIEALVRKGEGKCCFLFNVVDSSEYLNVYYDTGKNQVKIEGLHVWTPGYVSDRKKEVVEVMNKFIGSKVLTVNDFIENGGLGFSYAVGKVNTWYGRNYWVLYLVDQALIDKQGIGMFNNDWRIQRNIVGWVWS